LLRTSPIPNTAAIRYIRTSATKHSDKEVTSAGRLCLDATATATIVTAATAVTTPAPNAIAAAAAAARVGQCAKEGVAEWPCDVVVAAMATATVMYAMAVLHSSENGDALQ